METEVRKDHKGRKLRAGESYNAKTGKYRYTYTNPATNVRTSVYAWTLTPKDKLPAGKKENHCVSVRMKSMEKSAINLI